MIGPARQNRDALCTSTEGAIRFKQSATMRRAQPETVKDALMLSSRAAVKRAVADGLAERGDRIGALSERAEAADMETAADTFLDPRSVAMEITGPLPVKPGNGGELLMVTREMRSSIPDVVDTVRDSPDMLNATASRERLVLTGNAITLAVDAAESVKPRNSLEKMIAHELAVAHRLALHMAEQATRLVDRHETWGKINPAHSVEACRLANASFQPSVM